LTWPTVCPRRADFVCKAGDFGLCLTADLERLISAARVM